MTSRRFRTMAAAALAVALSGGAMPAQAQGIQFNFGFGTDGLHERRPVRLCPLTDSQLRRAIRRQGYTDIFLNVANDQRIQVRATRGGWVYLLLVNSCTGRILERERLRPS